MGMIPIRLEQLPQDLKWQVERFLVACPASPAARFRPDMLPLRNRWLAFLGPTLCEGAAGMGATPCAALADFNRHFGVLTQRRRPFLVGRDAVEP